MAKLFYLSLAALAISTASARPYNVEQVTDNDILDASGMRINVDKFNNLKRTTVEQFSDNDIIDLKYTKLNLPLLNVIKRTTVEQIKDDDILDLKNLNLNIIKRQDDAQQLSTDDTIDRKRRGSSKHHTNSAKKHCFKGKDGKIVQYSDNDVADLKNLGVDVGKLHAVKRFIPLSEIEQEASNDDIYRRDILQATDNDTLDAKNMLINLDVLHAFDKRASVDAAMDVLRRADYNVDLLTMKKRGVNDMYQYTDDTHTCYCAAKKTCSTPSFSTSKPKSKSKHGKERHHHKTDTHVLLPSPKHATHHEQAHIKEPAPVPIQAAPLPSTPVNTPLPTLAPSTCPSGWKHAGQGDVIQETDNDVMDLKNVKININLLGSKGEKKATKSVPATDKSTCTSEYCCYKTVKASDKVIQKSDNDIVDLKKLDMNVNLLNGLL